MNFKFKDKYGKEINVYKWMPDTDKEIKGVIQIAHGMTETAYRYDYVAKKLNEYGYIVYANDHRGHGYTAKDKDELGYLGEGDGFSLLVEDVKELNSIIREENKDLKIILLGHSMGSFVSQRYAQLYSDTIDGLILSGSNGKPKWITKIGMVIAKIEMSLKGEKVRSNLMDKLSFGDFNSNFKPARTKFDWMCSDSNEIDKYVNDERCGFICTTSFYHYLIKGLWNIHKEKNFKKVRKDLPIYIFSGDKDPVGYFGKGVNDLYERYKNIGVKNVKKKLYKNGRHEMLNEVNKDEVIINMKNWIDEI
ncbi:MAG: lysophospholipase [Clostridium baratii]|uniref:alpha/beta hydrolase n=1 Tax=Clostridium baratii TaxID=1561 RepID=UPI002430CECE|nr:alpha/beta hydrolase [Clostridium baratii]MBS6005755.1 lysophospholipase [Clostridium baratii]MDU1052821.1 lysophospholipase [Clostridium baratii]MDU4912161.1 lysophospholipase [Clostridium baratii]